MSHAGIGSLPYEILEYIVSFLDCRSVRDKSQVCRHLNAIATPCLFAAPKLRVSQLVSLVSAPKCKPDRARYVKELHLLPPVYCGVGAETLQERVKEAVEEIVERYQEPRVLKMTGRRHHQFDIDTLATITLFLPRVADRLQSLEIGHTGLRRLSALMDNVPRPTGVLLGNLENLSMQNVQNDGAEYFLRTCPTTLKALAVTFGRVLKPRRFHLVSRWLEKIGDHLKSLTLRCEPQPAPIREGKYGFNGLVAKLPELTCLSFVDLVPPIRSPDWNLTTSASLTFVFPIIPLPLTTPTP